MIAVYKVSDSLDSEPPMPWQKFLVLIAAGKAAVGAAGLVLALLGAMDIALASWAHEWYKSYVLDFADRFALVGGLLGGVVRLVFFR